MVRQADNDEEEPDELDLEQVTEQGWFQTEAEEEVF